MQETSFYNNFTQLFQPLKPAIRSDEQAVVLNALRCYHDICQRQGLPLSLVFSSKMRQNFCRFFRGLHHVEHFHKSHSLFLFCRMPLCKAVKEFKICNESYLCRKRVLRTEL